jgi:hypothetical protein
MVMFVPRLVAFVLVMLFASAPCLADTYSFHSMWIIHTKTSQGAVANYDVFATELDETTGAIKTCGATLFEHLVSGSNMLSVTGHLSCSPLKSNAALPVGKNFAFGGLDTMPSGMVFDASGSGVNHFDQDTVGGRIWWMADGQSGNVYICDGSPSRAMDYYACHMENTTF